MATKKAAAISLNLMSRKAFWPKSTELTGLTFDLVAEKDSELYPQYTIGLHAWFLQQIQALDPALSAYLHDAATEKAFNISGLSGQFTTHSRTLQLQAGKSYQWQVNGFSRRTVVGIEQWLRHLPDVVALKNAPLTIQAVRVTQGPTTYKALAKVAVSNSLNLSFVSPTSFRRKGHHLPLPWPTNVFHSYLRRWNEFSEQPIDQEAFLAWVDEGVIVQRHQLQTSKIAAGKRGSVTGFTGAITYGLSAKARSHPEFTQLFFSLGQFAPFCGTGHKTTFGLGQTRLGWQPSVATEPELPSAQVLLAERIEELTTFFVDQKKRTGGNRAQDSAEKWATILARRELGDSLQAIAKDMDLRYDTAKTYCKLARRALREQGD